MAQGTCNPKHESQILAVPLRCWRASACVLFSASLFVGIIVAVLPKALPTPRYALGSRKAVPIELATPRKPLPTLGRSGPHLAGAAIKAVGDAKLTVYAYARSREDAFRDLNAEQHWEVANYANVQGHEPSRVQNGQKAVYGGRWPNSFGSGLGASYGAAEPFGADGRGTRYRMKNQEDPFRSAWEATQFRQKGTKQVHNSDLYVAKNPEDPLRIANKQGWANGYHYGAKKREDPFQGVWGATHALQTGDIRRAAEQFEASSDDDPAKYPADPYHSANKQFWSNKYQYGAKNREDPHHSGWGATQVRHMGVSGLATKQVQTSRGQDFARSSEDPFRSGSGTTQTRFSNYILEIQNQRSPEHPSRSGWRTTADLESTTYVTGKQHKRNGQTGVYGGVWPNSYQYGATNREDPFRGGQAREAQDNTKDGVANGYRGFASREAYGAQERESGVSIHSQRGRPIIY